MRPTRRPRPRTRLHLAALLTSAALVPAALVVAPTSVVPASAVAASASAGSCRSGTVSLTFDDGPSSTVTPGLLSTLRRLKVPATFFMVGTRVAAAPATARLVERRGFLIANHTYAHANLTTQSAADARAALVGTTAALRKAGVHPTALMRPPYGAINDSVRSTASGLGLTPVLWDVDPRDWAGGTTATIASSILGQLRPHASNVVLQHDGVGNSPASVAAVPSVVAEARRRGYCFVALDERGRPGFPRPRVTLTATDAKEGHPVVARLRLSAPAGRATSAHLKLVSGTGTVGVDLPRYDRTVTVPTGSLSAVVSLPVTTDRTDEQDERVQVVMGHTTGLARGPHRVRVTLLDADPPPRLVGVDRTVGEPGHRGKTFRVEIRLSRPSARTVSFRYEIRPGSAGATDVAIQRGSVRVGPGSRNVLVPVRVKADDPTDPGERDETFSVHLLDLVRSRPGRDAVVTIRQRAASSARR